MKRPVKLTLMFLLNYLLAWPVSSLHGETFLLKNGGRVEGEWLNAEETPLTVYRIQTNEGGLVLLPADIVEQVVEKSDLLRRYEEFRATVADTAEGHWDMAQRCQKAGLKPQREFHLRKVLQFDSDHEAARHALGYSRVKGQWVMAEQWRAEHGFVRHRGQWRLAQEIELEQRAEKREEAEREWRTKIRRWHSNITRGRGDPQAALAEIMQIDSIRAIPALADLLEAEDTPRQLVLLYIEVIGRFDSARGAAARTRRLLQDADLEIRERCVDSLQERGSAHAVPLLVKVLGDKQNLLVNRAAWALGRLGDQAVIPDLIDALSTTHRFMVGSGGNMNVGFSSTGGDSLSTGGGPQLVQQELRNQEVLQALLALTPAGVNFQFDKMAWKNWYAQSRIPPAVNLRRDD